MSAPNLHAPLMGLDLPVLRARVTMRLLEDAPLPAYKGGMLRGGFGYAFQRASCPKVCWKADTCVTNTLCPFRGIFDTPHPPNVPHLHDLQDVPRPFVIEPPRDDRTHYRAGDTLEFGLVLIGRGIEQIAYFLFSFAQLGQMGLGRQLAKARLERVEVLHQWQAVGTPIYQDGRVVGDVARQGDGRYRYDAASIADHAATLPADLQITLHTPLRIKTRGDLLQTLAPAALVQAACWRLNALATFHGGGPWPVDHRALVAQAAQISVAHAQVQWVDWERTSTRTPEPRTMKLGGLVGSAVLRNVPTEVRAVLLAGSLVHIGKACVFGHGAYTLEAM